MFTSVGFFSLTSVKADSYEITPLNDGDFIEEERVIASFEYIDPDLVGTTLPNSNSSEITPRFIGHEVKSKVYPVEIKEVFVKPDGQPTYGYQGGSGATVFFFSYEGSDQSVKMSFKLGTSTLSSTIDVKKGKVSGSGTGYAALVPNADTTKKPWFFWFRQTHRIEPTKHDYYGNGTYRSSHVTIKSLGYSLSHMWRHQD